MATAKYTRMPAPRQGNTISRRNLLAASPAACLMAAVGGAYVAGGQAVAETAAAGPSDTPVMALYRQWKAQWNWLESDAAKALPEDEFDRQVDVRLQIEDKMLETPSRAPEDWAAKIIACSANGNLDINEWVMPDLWAEARALVAA